MPNAIKAGLSVVAALVAAALAYYEYRAGRSDLTWIVLGAGAFMILAMWIFPEAASKKNPGGE